MLINNNIKTLINYEDIKWYLWYNIKKLINHEEKKKYV